MILFQGNGLVITPFERNLEIWRQLWRVVERSHVVVQVVAAIFTDLLIYRKNHCLFFWSGWLHIFLQKLFKFITFIIIHQKFYCILSCCQVVDARNPLLFRSRDLETFVEEVDPRKRNVLLINKADLLTPEQVAAWSAYFESQGIQTIFW